MNELARQLSKVILINRLLGTNAAISEQDTQKAIEILEGKHMRILKGYSEEEQKEFKTLGKLDYPLEALLQSPELCVRNLAIKINSSNIGSDKDKQILQDIADYVNGKAKFPEQKYRVALPDGNYLVKDPVDGNRWMFTYSDNNGCNFVYATGCEDTFTKEQIENIDPKLMAFAVPVEADDE